MDDKDRIEKNRWLNDTVVNAARWLLDKYGRHGSQDSCVFQKKKGKSKDYALQPLHVGGNHWVLLSYSRGRLILYDTLPGLVPNEELAAAIWSIGGERMRLWTHAKVEIVPVPAQGNGSLFFLSACASMMVVLVCLGIDCGLWVIVLMTELVLNPTAILSERSWASARAMRQHVLIGLSQQCMKPFPGGELWKMTASDVIEVSRPLTRVSAHPTRMDQVVIDDDGSLPCSLARKSAVVVSDDEKSPAASVSSSGPVPLSRAVSAVNTGPDLAPESRFPGLLRVRAIIHGETLSDSRNFHFLFATFKDECSEVTNNLRCGCRMTRSEPQAFDNSICNFCSHSAALHSVGNLPGKTRAVRAVALFNY